MRRILTLLIVLLVLVACSCGDTAENDPTTTTAPDTTTTASGMDVAGSTTRAVAFSEDYWGSWPDTDGALEKLADDVVFYDPSDGDFVIEGKAVIAPTLRGFVAYFSDVEPVVEEVFVSATGAAYRLSYGHGYWPPFSVEPADHPRIIELDELHFAGDAVSGFDIWFEDDTLGTLGFGCFAANGCPDLATIIDHYVTAWTSGDPGQIAALYDNNATFTDSLLRIDAVGPQEISRIAEARFGPADVTLEVVEIYAQTNGWKVPTELDGNVGEVIAVGLHYRVSSRSEDFTSFEGLATFEFGTRHANGFTPHSNGLITREEAFHNTSALAAFIP